MPFLNKEEPVNNNINFGIAAIAVFAFLVFGCAAPTRVEMDYGTSYKLQKFNQTLDPDAEKNLELVEGLDGNAAAAIVGQYYKGFTATQQAPTYNISIGSGGGSGLGMK